MGDFKRLKFGVLAGAAVTVAGLTNGCSAASSLQNGLCCKAYQPGTNMLSASFTGSASANAQFAVFAQASGDLETVAEGTVADVQAACLAIATDLGDTNQLPAGTAGTDVLKFWCNEAVTQINGVLMANASATLNINFQPPECSASVSVNADCQAHCNVNGSCNVQANPPKCMGGTLEVSCQGNCTAMGGASIDCTGQCTGNCSGSCTGSVSSPVACQGKCDGTCAAGGMGGGSGVQADGSCQGTCTGKCTLSNPTAKVMCTGTCGGQCDASCNATAMGSVQCSGSCSGMATPLSCKGGTLSGGCMVDANCSANCNASASAKAECTPPAVTITFTGTVSVQDKLTALVNTLEANLPKLLIAVKARGMAFANLIGTVSASGSASVSAGLDAQGVACLAQIGPSIAQAATDFPVAISSSVSVLGAVKIQ